MNARYRRVLDWWAPHFHICNRSGPDEGPVFYQHEAWPVREMVMRHLCRLIEDADKRGGD